MEIIDKLSSSFARTPDPKAAEAPAPSVEPRSRSTLSQTVTFGRNGDGEVAEVILDYPEKDIHRPIIDHAGYFKDFPGIVRGSWEHYIEGKFDFDAGAVCYRTSFEWREWGYRCFWEIQPGGEYWADDDGYGAEDDTEIVLYADLNEEGDFMGPFCVYSIDGRRQTDQQGK